MNIELMEKYEKETSGKAMYRKESSDYHTLRYVTWLENNNVDLKALLKRCLEALQNSSCGGCFHKEIEIVQLISEIEEAIK